ncbi:spore germination protein [Paenibacillus sp. YYML68]|uniref:spore germination protein n=1 Tax=Paenibacillus sp. YYML68 TaxID=2909250 RepID=UPI00248FBB29|nr:spore germination protein [Paenibacillus sp. YYML68]
MTSTSRPSSHGPASQPLETSLRANLARLEQAFGYPDNVDLHIRSLHIPALRREAFLLYLEGVVDESTVEHHVLQPLLTSMQPLPEHEDRPASLLLQRVLQTASARIVTNTEDVVHDLLNGFAVLLIEFECEAVSVNAPGFQARSVDIVQTENVLLGPKEAFVESATINRSLVRKNLKEASLITESITIGHEGRQIVHLMYLKTSADPELIQTVKQRIQSIESTTVSQLSMLAQYMEDRPYSLLPTYLITERPDRACAFLNEGHVVLIMESSPHALIAPVTFWSLFHTSEDMYQRFFYGNFIRMIRLFSFFVALLTPALYIAITNYHVEMVPTDLVLAIGATREKVPLPAIFEVLIMELTFELLREAGIRIPSMIGPTIGIVGALILGQAAVDANIISPILVIVVAITGLASFTISDISFSFVIRITRFAILASAAILGFFGMSLLLTVLIAYMVSVKSFGVPFLYPVAPYSRSANDTILRPTVWKLWLRPFQVRMQMAAKRSGGGNRT